MKAFHLLLFFLAFCMLNMKAQNVRIEHLQKVQTTLEKEKNTTQYQEVLFDLGLAYDGIDIQKVAQYAKELKNCPYPEVKPFAQVRGNLLEAYNGINLGKPSQVLRGANKALAIAENQQDSLGIGIAHLCFGFYYILTYQVDSLEKHSRKSLEFLSKLDEKWAIEAGIIRSIYSSFNGNSKHTIKFLDSLNNLNSVQNDSLLHLRINLKLALAHSINTAYQKGSVYLHQADLLLKKQHYPKYLIEFYYIQDDYFWGNQPEKSIEIAKKGLEIAKQYGFKYQEIRIRNILGYYYIGTENYETAESLLLENMNYSKKEKIYNMYTISWLFLAINYRGKREKNLAITTLLNLLKFSDKHKIWGVIPSALTELSELTEIGENEEVDEVFEKFNGMEDRYSSNYHQMRLLKIAQKRAERNGDLVKAIEFANRRIESLNEYSKSRDNSKYIELEAAYRNEMKDNEIKNQDKIIEINKTHKSILIGICTILLLSMMLSVYLVYRRQHYLKELKVQNEALQNQQAEIIALNLELSNKNEALAKQNKMQGQDLFEYILLSEKREEQINALEKVFKKVKAYLISSDSNADVKILERKIGEIKSETDDWVAFRQKFNQLHPNFIKNLLTMHPTINKRELKHCIYLKLNLPSKKIAEIMFISPKSVETARYRIKKKLGLSPKDKMKDYLNAIS